MINQGPEDRFVKIELPAAYKMVAEAIEQEIISGRLTPGDEIGTEAQLVRQFGVNRSTVREGIRALEQSGFVRREARRKLFVCLPQMKTLSKQMSKAMILHKVSFQELYNTAMLLEIGATETAVENATEEDIAALEENQSHAEKAINDPGELANLDSEFHELLAKISHNRVFELAREPAALLYFPTAELICRIVPEAPSRLIAAHRHIIDAIKTKDMECAKKWMEKHVRDWKKGFEKTGLGIDEPIGRFFVKFTQKSDLI